MEFSSLTVLPKDLPLFDGTLRVCVSIHNVPCGTRANAWLGIGALEPISDGTAVTRHQLLD